MRRLSGYDGEERDRLVREHREYIAGTRDRDADFGNGDGATLPAPPPPPTTGRRPRMTVLIKPKVPLKKQKKGALAEELAEKATEAEEESGQEDDEEYVVEEEVIDAEELLLPPNKSARGKRGNNHRSNAPKRRIPRSQGQKESVPCPSSMKAYHRWTVGVDVHDQLSLRFRKYYKSLAFGLFDIAIANSFIVSDVL
ncbi:hypothetical protein PInf_004319 [Phytophthora infestans]|nr:hypothetical protein PInf_004319 [Phytophthora infestans]